MTAGDQGERRGALVPALFAGSVALHVYLAFKFPLAPDETYYWEWSRRPAWGYYDQGPMVAWWIRAGCLLFGETPLGVRLSAILAALGTLWFVYRLTFLLFGRAAASLALWPTLVTPLALAGSFVATYDPIMVMFGAGVLYFVALALFEGRPRSWYLAGLLLGLGLLTKHTIVLLAPCALFYLAVSPEHRSWLRRKEPYVACLISVLVFSPNLVWQSNHDWMTFNHLFFLTEKGTDHHWPRRIGDFLGSQFGLMTPLLFFGMIAAMIWPLRQPTPERRFLACFALPIFAFFTLMTFKAKVQANWAGLGWVPAFALYGGWVADRLENRAIRRYNLWSLASCGIFAALILWPESRLVIGIRSPAKWDQTSKLYGGRELAAAVAAERASMATETGQEPAIGAPTYDTASRLAFYVEGQPRTRCFFIGTRMNSYALWNDEAGLKPGDNAIIAYDRPMDDPVFPPLHRVFERFETVAEPVTVYRRRLYPKPVRTYYLFRGYVYRPNPEVEVTKGG